MKKILLISLIAFLGWSCSEEEIEGPAYNGTDNFIVSFGVIKDGITYPASITGEEITVTVNYNVDLAGAKAEVVLTENATITPDPAEISDWSQEWQFLVTSHAEEDRTYKYIVVRSEISSVGDVVLTTQQQVDEFGKSGIRSIAGNLTIGSESEDVLIENLEGLSELREVANTLRILGSYTGTGLEGLENLKSAGNILMGDVLSISSNRTLIGFSLPALETVKGNLFLVSSALEEVSLTQLSSVEGSVVVKSDAIREIDLPVLTGIEGDFVLAGTTGNEPGGELQYLYMPELQEVKGNLHSSGFRALTGYAFTKLQHVGDITFAALPDMRDVMMNQVETCGNLLFGDCPSIESVIFPQLVSCGGISLENSTLLSVLNFPSLTTIQGDLRVTKSLPLTTLSGLEKVESIEGDIYFEGMALLSGIGEMENLKSVHNITLHTLPGMSGEIDLSKLDLNGGKLYIQTLSKDISSIKGPAQFNGSIEIIQSNGGIPSFEGFNTWHGSLALRNLTNGAATELLLPDVEYIENLILNGCYQLRVISTDKVKEIGGTLMVNSFCGELSFPLTERIGQQLYVSGANTTTMTGCRFSVLTTVGKGIPDDITYSENSFEIGLKSYQPEFPLLKTVNGSVKLETSPAQTKIQYLSFPSLATVTGNMQIGYIWSFGNGGNTTITTIDMGALTTVEGTFLMQNMAAITDFSTFAGLRNSLSADRWNVSLCGYNPAWQDMLDGKYTE
ncbi:MAG: hypothetical protein LUG98_00015 [Tannerellaceae bacterium]|nr:hypothetical protein [Tannerellaceae bacterium]